MTAEHIILLYIYTHVLVYTVCTYVIKVVSKLAEIEQKPLNVPLLLLMLLMIIYHVTTVI
jgi:hypothetical protein